MEVPAERAVPNPQPFPVPEPRWYPNDPVRRMGKLARFSPRIRTVARQNEVPEMDGVSVNKPMRQLGSSRIQHISIFPKGTEEIRASGTKDTGSDESNNGVPVKDVPMYCLKGAIAVFVPILLAIIGCCIWIRRRRQKQQRLMELAKARNAAYERSYADRRTRYQHRVPGHPARMPPPRPPSPIYTPMKPHRPPPPPPSYRGW
ncbi:uncharacterized protein [Excalfactoria chinensis]|uniref:uncharacterized protein n=1 Tax=Excalfactoria chinensis TaxID=46218 RepID=UPI003B3B7B97